MARVRAVHVGEHQFRGRAREVVFKLSRDERTPAGLGVELEHLGARAGAENVAHSDRPNFSRDTREGDVFDIEAAIEKEGKPRAKLIDWNAARGQQLDVGEARCKRVSSLLHWSRIFG